MTTTNKKQLGHESSFKLDCVYCGRGTMKKIERIREPSQIISGSQRLYKVLLSFDIVLEVDNMYYTLFSRLKGIMKSIPVQGELSRRR